MTQYFLPEQKEEQSDDDPENNNHGKLEHGGVRACPPLIPRMLCEALRVTAVVLGLQPGQESVHGPDVVAHALTLISHASVTLERNAVRVLKQSNLISYM